MAYFILFLVLVPTLGIIMMSAGNPNDKPSNKGTPRKHDEWW